MRIGQVVKLRDAFGNELLRRIVAWDETNVYVCRDDEFVDATAEVREPLCIGFNRKYVLGVVNEGS